LNVQVALPHSTGKTKKVVLVTPEVIAELEAGKVTFDVILATPETMPKLVKFAKLLGPRGLMPNPKNGTLVKEASAIDKFSTDTISVKTEKKAPVIHVALGKVSMDSEKLAENLAAVIAAINPKIIVKAYLTSSMGPSVKLQAA
jgi:large subunit ribosomal protein L1